MRGRQANNGKAGVFRLSLRVAAYAGPVAACLALAAPGVGNAWSAGIESAPVSLAARGGIGSFTPASVDPRLVARFAAQPLIHGKLLQFTPAGTETRPDRAVTVVVRLPDVGLSDLGARAIGGHKVANVTGLAAVRIAPMAYNLGQAHGYTSFATPQAPRDFERLNAPDISTISNSANSGASAQPSRLATNIAIDDKERVGRAPRTLESEGTYQVDMGGSYRVVGNLHVTAGLRYSSDRDRLNSLTDRKLDSQAVYVGTQFRF